MQKILLIQDNTHFYHRKARQKFNSSMNTIQHVTAASRVEPRPSDAKLLELVSRLIEGNFTRNSILLRRCRRCLRQFLCSDKLDKFLKQ